MDESPHKDVDANNPTVPVPVYFTLDNDGNWATMRFGEMLHPDDRADTDTWGHAG